MIIQAGMVWVSGWRLASAVSNAGGLGLIGGGSMTPDLFREHIRKCKAATNEPFGVNIPLMYSHSEEQMDIVMKEGIGIVFTSAGNPGTFTELLKVRGIQVAHVVSNVSQAKKAVDRGVDAVVAEGFEAGGHNGRDEITTMCLVPQVVDAVGDRVPVIAAGGIGDGRAMAAALALGASAVQVGTRFAVCQESSAHETYKQLAVQAGDGDTALVLKSLIPTRLLKTPFYEAVQAMEAEGATSEHLKELLGRGRARKGIFEGNLDEGEFEIGQISGMINDIPTAHDIIMRFLDDFRSVKGRLDSVIL
jgi:enoyl-[acyl-carrier protein] reductase II